jgi:hypothetical protein
MQLIRTETGKWAILEMDDEDVQTLYFAASDYSSTLMREQTLGCIHGVNAGPEDMAFLADAAPKAERVRERYVAACEERLEKEGLI